MLDCLFNTVTYLLHLLQQKFIVSVHFIIVDYRVDNNEVYGHNEFLNLM